MAKQTLPKIAPGSGDFLGEDGYLAPADSRPNPYEHAVFQSGSAPAEAPEDHEHNEENYQPVSPVELVRGTPVDIVAFTESKLSKETRRANGHELLALPYELNWWRGSPLEAEVTYTAVVQIVHAELERFIERLNKYYVLTPRHLVEETAPGGSEESNG